METQQIKKRIEYLKSELNHKRYYDGWSIEGMQKELEKLEKRLKESDNETD